MLKTEYQFIRFEEDLRRAGFAGMRKTGTWRCISVRHNDVLGMIAWQGPWRQYVFVPIGGTVFSAGCLKDIQDFIRQLMDGRRA